MKLTQSLTFDDVLIRPAYSKILPREVDTKTKFSSDIDIFPLSSKFSIDAFVSVFD